MNLSTEVFIPVPINQEPDRYGLHGIITDEGQFGAKHYGPRGWLNMHPNATHYLQKKTLMDVLGSLEIPEVIEDLLQAIPKQTEDGDWWDSNLVQAVDKAKKFLEQFKPTK